MRNLSKSLLGLWLIGMGLGGSALAQNVANGPYYVTPSWNQTLACTALNNCPRFIVLSNMGSAAVLDRETGLVWERSPSTSTISWLDASFHCINLDAGGRTGWRLPTIPELMSLVDRSVSPPGVALPSGHPFGNVQANGYWSATSLARNAIFAWHVAFGNSGLVGSNSKSFGDHAWCVRGGQGPDAQ